MKKNIRPLYHFGVPPVLILTGVRLALDDWPENWLLDCETFALGMMHLHQNRRWVRDSLMLFSVTAPPPDQQDDDAVDSTLLAVLGYGIGRARLSNQGAQVDLVIAHPDLLVLADRIAWRRVRDRNQALIGHHCGINRFPSDQLRFAAFPTSITQRR